jgi:hypothetical protein
MNKSIAATLAVLLLGCLVRPANAQYYPYPPAAYGNPYSQPTMPVQYMPMSYAAPGAPMMPQPMMGQPMMGQPMMGQPMMGQPMMGQPMMPQQPVMMVPVMVTRIVPMLGPLETMPSGGPLDSSSLATANARASAKPAVSVTPVAAAPAPPSRPTVPAAVADAKLPATEGSVQQTSATQPNTPELAKPWYKKLFHKEKQPEQKEKEQPSSK